MNRNHDLTTRAAIATAIGLAFSACATADSTSKDELNKAAQLKIEADYKAAKAACEALEGDRKDICMAEAKGAENVARAGLGAMDKPEATGRREMRDAQSKADYAVALEKCDTRTGDAKSDCVNSAKLRYGKW
ncbi:hypothetical protein [Usitatibacter palustris]|uniref:Uncharacterized protein n=1 Tax=Usitatibacter palustris TaxID=2732487 RepID=A0A6M4HAM9_9PROT|nr:hypothetical protein [Usitatibacter palustris]QJR16710.1 hypothetical protein DSM104440_03546 [Usitatibacter palustris]